MMGEIIVATLSTSLLSRNKFHVAWNSWSAMSCSRRRCALPNCHYRLLVVDDEPFIRDLFQKSFPAENYEVNVAEDGFDALAKMRGALPDLILTDMKMPNMSGFKFLSVIRRRFPQIPTIAHKRRISACCPTLRSACGCVLYQTV